VNISTTIYNVSFANNASLIDSYVTRSIYNANDYLLTLGGDPTITRINIGGSGTSTIAIGANALAANTTGTNNTAVGANALAANAIGSYNTALGDSALAANTTGSYNVAIGPGAMVKNIAGLGNTVVGINSYNTAKCNTNYNTIIGCDSMKDENTISSGEKNTTLGAYTRIYNAASNSTVIGYGATASESNLIVLGTTTETVVLSSTPRMAYTTFPLDDNRRPGYIYTSNQYGTTDTGGGIWTNINSVTLPIGIWIVSGMVRVTGDNDGNDVYHKLALRKSAGSGSPPGNINTPSLTGDVDFVAGARQSVRDPLTNPAFHQIIQVTGFYSVRSEDDKYVGLYGLSQRRNIWYESRVTVMRIG